MEREPQEEAALMDDDFDIGAEDQWREEGALLFCVCGHPRSEHAPGFGPNECWHGENCDCLCDDFRER